MRVNYAKVTGIKRWTLDWLLWASLSPGGQAICLVLTGLFWRWKAQSQDDSGKLAYLDASNSFFWWGVVNCVAYLWLAHRQRS